MATGRLSVVSWHVLLLRWCYFRVLSGYRKAPCCVVSCVITEMMLFQGAQWLQEGSVLRRVKCYYWDDVISGCSVVTGGLRVVSCHVLLLRWCYFRVLSGYGKAQCCVVSCVITEMMSFQGAQWLQEGSVLCCVMCYNWDDVISGCSVATGRLRVVSCHLWRWHKVHRIQLYPREFDGSEHSTNWKPKTTRYKGTELGNSIIYLYVAAVFS